MSASVRLSSCHPETSLRSTQTEDPAQDPTNYVLLNAGRGPASSSTPGTAAGQGPTL